MYLDDFIVVARSQELICSVVRTLPGDLLRHRSGELIVGRSASGDFRKDSFKFLGYILHASDDGQPLVDIPIVTRLKMERRIMSATINEARNGDSELRQTRRCLKSALSQYPHWGERQEFRNHWLVCAANLEDEAFRHALGDFRKDRYLGTYSCRRGPNTYENQPPPGAAEWIKESWGENP